MALLTLSIGNLVIGILLGFRIVKIKASGSVFHSPLPSHEALV